jgi:hypothetical protein
MNSLRVSGIAGSPEHADLTLSLLEGGRYDRLSFPQDKLDKIP